MPLILIDVKVLLLYPLYLHNIHISFARALSKVQQLVADHGREEAKVLETDEAKRKEKLKKRELDQMLSSYHGRDISKEQEDKWYETLKTGMNISCPCKVNLLRLKRFRLFCRIAHKSSSQ